mgnify:CR=1 FL=1
MNKKILVTGAEGFIGSHLTERLVEKGYNVRALVLYNFKNSYGWLDDINFSIRKKIEIVSGDIKDLSYLINITKDVDAIIHLAALISIPYSYVSPKSYIDNNIFGSYNILESAKINKIKKVIMTSTSEVYGTAKFVPITEEHSLNAQSPYAASKIASDQLALSYFKSFDLPVTIIRPFNTFGPRQSLRAIIPTILTQALSKKKQIVIGSLKPKRDFTYIEDTVSAFILALKSKKILGKEINIGSSFEVSIGEIIDIIKKDFKIDFKLIIDKKRIRPKKSEVFRLMASNRKAKKYLNWEPNYRGKSGFKIALKKTLEWYKNSENLKYFKSDFYNI